MNKYFERAGIAAASLTMLAGCSPETTDAYPPQNVTETTTASTENAIPVDKLGKSVCNSLRSLVHDYGYPSTSPLVSFFGEVAPGGEISIYGEDKTPQVAETLKKLGRKLDGDPASNAMKAGVEEVIVGGKEVVELSSTILEADVETDQYGVPQIYDLPQYDKSNELAKENKQLAIYVVRSSCENPSIR